MGQTINTYDKLFYAENGQPARHIEATILSGEGALLAGTLLILDPTTQKYILPDVLTNPVGMTILLEDADATSADADAKIGLAGAIDKSNIILAGTVAAFNESVRAILAMNNIFVNVRTDSMTNV